MKEEEEEVVDKGRKEKVPKTGCGRERGGRGSGGGGEDVKKW